MNLHCTIDMKMKDLLEDDLDRLEEKRVTAHEKALIGLASTLQMYYSPNAVDGRKSKLEKAILKSVHKHGTIQEGVLALQCLSILSFVIGTESSAIFLNEKGKLKLLITDKSNPPELRTAAVNALCALTFVGCTDEIISREILTFFGRLLAPSEKGETGFVLERTVAAWSVLLTTISADYISENATSENLAYVVQLLDNDDPKVKIAAGEALCTFFWQARAHYDDKFNFDLFSEQIDKDTMLDRLFELSKNNSRHTAKKERVEQRKAFKGLSAVVEHGECEPEMLTVENEKMMFEDWIDIVKLRFIRDILGPGLPVHLAQNDLLHDIFDLSSSRFA